MFLASLSSLAYLTYLIYPTYPTYHTYHIYLTYLTCLTILPFLHLSNILVTSRNSPVLDNPVDPIISVSFCWSKAWMFLELPFLIHLIYLNYITYLTYFTLSYLFNILVISKTSPVFDNPVDPVISVSFIWSKAWMFLELPRSQDPDSFSQFPVLGFSPIFNVQRRIAGAGKGQVCLSKSLEFQINILFVWVRLA